MLPFFRKLKSVYGPARLLSFLRDEFTLAQESTQMATITFTADGCVNNNKFRKYILRCELCIKCITKRQRPSNTQTFFLCHPPKVTMGLVEEEALHLLERFVTLHV